MEGVTIDSENGTPMEISKTAEMTVKTPSNAGVWVEKYRPERLEDLVAHEEIISILTKLIDDNNLPHLLLYGPPGTGKTSTIVAAAKRMYGSASAYSSMALELNASDARSIDVSKHYLSHFHSQKLTLHPLFPGGTERNQRIRGNTPTLQQRNQAHNP